MHGYLRHLANFAYVVESGSLTAAAARLGTGPSSISESVRILEGQCGEPLLDRHHRGVTPTVRGAQLYESARQIVDSLHAALEEPSEKPPEGIVRVSVPSEFAVDWFSPGYQRLLAEHPKIQLHVHVEDGLLDHRRFTRDLYVRAGHGAVGDGLTVHHTLETAAILVGSPDLAGDPPPTDPDAVARFPFLGRQLRDGAAVLSLSAGDQAEVRFPNGLVIDGIGNRIALARRGVGLVACLERTVASDLEARRMVRLLPERFQVPVTAVLGTPQAKPSPAVRAVIEALARVL
ncbi:MAG: LysR family transcriptional regulator [Pseudomonadota bacterium]